MDKESFRANLEGYYHLSFNDTVLYINLKFLNFKIFLWPPLSAHTKLLRQGTFPG